MGEKQSRRADERRELKNAYVEYHAESGLRRLFHRGGPKRGALVDLSRGGVQFRTQEELAVGTRLAAAIILPEVHERPTVKVEVRWVREEHRISSVNFTHLIGARFTEYSPEAWHTLKEFLKDGTDAPRR